MVCGGRRQRWFYARDYTSAVTRAGRGLVVTKTLPNQQTDLSPSTAISLPSFVLQLRCKSGNFERPFLKVFLRNLTRRFTSICCCRAVKRRPTATGRGAFFAKKKKKGLGGFVDEVSELHVRECCGNVVKETFFYISEDKLQSVRPKMVFSLVGFE